MILFLGFKIGIIYFRHEAKAVLGLFCLKLIMVVMVIWQDNITQRD